MKQITLSSAPCSATLSRLVYALRLSGISDVSCCTLTVCLSADSGVQQQQ